jgi:hypothetical protein
MKTLVIGDSHVGGFKKAAKLLNYNPRYVVSASNEPINLKLLSVTSDGILTSKNSELVKQMKSYGEHTIKLSQYDQIILVGLRTELPYKVFDQYNSSKLGLVASKAALYDTLKDIIEKQSIMYYLVALIRNQGLSIPIKLILNPLLSNSIKNVIIPTAPGMKPSARYGGDMNVSSKDLKLWLEVINDCFSFGNVEILKYFPETLTEGAFTKSELSLGSNNPGELRHMNEVYWSNYISLLNKND